MADHVTDIPTNYLPHALLRGFDASKTFLANIQQLDDIFSLASTQLKPTPDGTYITPHQKRNSPTNNTQYIISFEGCLMSSAARSWSGGTGTARRRCQMSLHLLVVGARNSLRPLAGRGSGRRPSGGRGGGCNRSGRRSCVAAATIGVLLNTTRSDGIEYEKRERSC